MAAHTIEREIFAFSENAKEVMNSTRPLSLASDGRLLLCCRDLILVLTVSCDLDVRSDSFIKNLPCKVHVQKVVDRANLPPFSIMKGVLNLMDVLKNMCDNHDRQELLVDSSLHDGDFFPKVDEGGFRSAVISTQHICTRRCYIAAVTHDHRVLVFEEHSKDWRLCCEFSSKLKCHITAFVDMPVMLGADGMSFVQYKDFIYSMSCVDIAWSSVFGSSKSEEGILLLFCGMRNGDIQIWKMQTPHTSTETDENAFTFIAVDKYASEVTSLFWHCTGSNKGYLAVGYMNGSIRILVIQMSKNGTQQFNVDVFFEQKFGDQLTVSDLALTKINHDVFILLACKQFSIAMFRLTHIQVEYLKTIHIDCSLPLESLTVRGNLASASSQDGEMHHFLINSDSDDISLQGFRSKVMCLPNVTETNWSCKGATLSQHGALCYSVHKPFSNVTLSGRSHGRFLHRQLLILSLTPNFQNDYFPSTCSDKYPYPESWVDLTLRLLFQMQNAYKDSTSFETTEQILSTFIASDRIKCLQIARAVYLFEFLKLWTGAPHKQSLMFSKESKLRELTLLILVKHVSYCFQSAKECNIDFQTQLPFMCQWVKEKEERLNALTKCMSVDKSSVFTHIEPLKHMCCLCDSEVKICDDLLEAKCTNGHSFQLCCVTLNPAEGLKLRHCLACNAVAFDFNTEEAISIPYAKRVHSCTLCGGDVDQS